MRLRGLSCCAIAFVSAGLLLAQRSNSATPRTADGHPDLTGLWNSTAPSVFVKSDDPLASNLASRDGTLLNFERDFTLVRRADPNKPLYKPQFWEKVQQGDQNGNTDDPSYGCMPAGVPRMGPPAKIVQTPKELVFLYVSPPAQGWGDQYRVIPTDGRAHTPLADLDGTWKGESIGHWEGGEDDTLVIDTIGFNDTSWLEIGGYLHSENMHVTERLRREGDLLTWQATVEDPDVLIKPWTMNPRTLKINPDPKAVLSESLPCVERDLSHLVTKEHH
jgi:hypothetical protein